MTPFGPYIVATDELDPTRGLELTCEVDGEVRQHGNTSDMIFTSAQLISYISQFMTLEPGDLIATGTPAGVGLSLHPRNWLKPEQTLVTRIEGIGAISNRCSQPYSGYHKVYSDGWVNAAKKCSTVWSARSFLALYLRCLHSHPYKGEDAGTFVDLNLCAR